MPNQANLRLRNWGEWDLRCRGRVCLGKGSAGGLCARANHIGWKQGNVAYRVREAPCSPFKRFPILLVQADPDAESARIALNCFKDLRRDHWDYVPLVEADEPQIMPDFRSDDAFFELIRPLSPEERALVTLRFVYEYQVDEIAELMNLKSGTTKSKLSRALEKLR